MIIRTLFLAALLGAASTTPVLAQDDWSEQVLELQQDDRWCPAVANHLLPSVMNLVLDGINQSGGTTGDRAVDAVIIALVDMIKLDKDDPAKMALLAMACKYLTPVLAEAIAKQSGLSTDLLNNSLRYSSRTECPILCYTPNQNGKYGSESRCFRSV